jgi:hypothetical protein
MSARGAITLTLANVATGVLNYAFQVHAGVALDAAAFGTFSAWLAQVTLVGSIASVVQFLSLDFPVTRFDAIVRGLGVASIAAVVGQIAFGKSLDLFALGAITVGGGILLYAVLGQLQGRLRLGHLGAAVFVAAGVRVGLSFVTTFYVAQAAAAFAGIAAVGLVTFGRDGATGEARPTARAPFGVRLFRSILLAFAAVVFPQLDVLVLSLREDAATLGHFARIALVARIVFFAGSTVLPVLHSHQLRAVEDHAEPPAFVLVAQRWLSPVTIAGSLVLAFVADRAVLHLAADQAAWLYLSCPSMAVLVSILGQLQRIAVRGEVARATSCLGGVLVASALASILSAGNVTRYVVLTCVGNALVLAVSTVLASRPCRS